MHNLYNLFDLLAKIKFIMWLCHLHVTPRVLARCPCNFFFKATSRCVTWTSKNHEALQTYPSATARKQGKNEQGQLGSEDLHLVNERKWPQSSQGLPRWQHPGEVTFIWGQGWQKWASPSHSLHPWQLLLNNPRSLSLAAHPPDIIQESVGQNTYKYSTE